MHRTALTELPNMEEEKESRMLEKSPKLFMHLFEGRCVMVMFLQAGARAILKGK